MCLCVRTPTSSKDKEIKCDAHGSSVKEYKHFTIIGWFKINKYNLYNVILTIKQFLNSLILKHKLKNMLCLISGTLLPTSMDFGWWGA